MAGENGRVIDGPKRAVAIPRRERVVVVWEILDHMNY